MKESTCVDAINLDSIQEMKSCKDAVAFRIKKGLTQEEMAAYVGLSLSAITKIESKARRNKPLSKDFLNRWQQAKERNK